MNRAGNEVMRTGLAVSLVGHVALIAWGVIALPATKPLDTSHIEAIPVDFLTVTDETSVPKGMKTADLVRDVTPADTTPPKVEEPPPLPRPPPPDPKTAQPEPAPAPPQPPEPKVAEPAPPPPPQPPAPKPVAEAKADVPPPPETPVAAPPDNVPIPRLAPAQPKPAPQVAKKKDQPFDIDKITAMLDKQATPEQPAPQPAPQPTPADRQATIGSLIGADNPQMTASELDALRARLSQCWSPPLGWTDPAEVRVVLMIYLNSDGSIGGAPQVLQAPQGRYAQTAPESAVRAVRRCAPYNLPPEKYEAWKEVKVTFDPTDMGGVL